MIRWINYKVLTKITRGIQHRISTPGAVHLYSAAGVSL